MLKSKSEIEDEAIGWVIRLRCGDARDWETFTAWLEADPAHARAYEEMALCDAESGEIIASISHAQGYLSGPRTPARAAGAHHRFGRRAFLGWSLAASLLLVTGYAVTRENAGPYFLETGLGEHRIIDLADGSRVELNGGTKVILDSDRPRFARLERGEALFHVVHDSSRPFEVKAGDAILRDLGTIFNVVREEGRLEVAVSEGAVVYNPDREAANISAGMALRKEAGAQTWLGRVETRGVGSWREGRLVYTGAPVSRIAADLERNLGLPVAVEPQAASLAFSGVIMLEGERTTVLKRAAALLGVRLSPDGEGWILEAGAGGAS
jgi:transmembrane sensor